MANATTNRQVNVYINSGEAAKAYDVLIKREKLLNEELKKTADPKRIKQLTAELDKLKDPIDRAAKKMKGELAPSIRELELATRKFLNEFKKTGTPESLANFQKFRAELAKAKGDITNLDNSQKGLTSKGIFSGAFWGSLLAGAAQAAIRGIGDFFGGVIQEALDADIASRRLQSTLDNLGRGDAFDRINRKADELAAKFRYLDNDDIVGVFNRLIDYGKLTEKEMNKLLPVIIDFAAKSNISIDESSSIIIKALEGNGKALKEYGINIKDSGTDVERFNTIMTTLKEKVDGSGEAFQNSAQGGILTARQELKNLQEEIGTLIIPALNKLLSWVLRALNSVKTFFKTIRDGFQNSFRITGVINATIDRAVDDAFQNLGQKAQDDIQKVLDEVALQSNATLGIDSSSKSSGKTIKEKAKEYDLLGEALKRLYDIQAKGDDAVRKMGNQFEGTDKAFAEKLKALMALSGKVIDPAEDNKRIDRSRLAKNELAVLTSRGKERLKAELALLKEQERQTLDNTKLTENEKLLIEEQFRQKKKDAEAAYLEELVANIAAYAQKVADIASIFGQIQTEKENSALARDKAINDQKQRNLEKRLKAGLITQLQYDKETQAIQREQEKREKEVAIKQFKRQQRADIVQALINGALAITSTLAAKPGALDIISLSAFRAINVGLAVATTAAQVAAIASKKPPTFAAGGRLGGRSHAAGGNAVIDGSGRKIAEVEAGEGIVNKQTMSDRRQYSVSGTPGQIISRLNSMYGSSWEGGATLVPGWRNITPQRMNYAAMKSMYYAAGGTFAGTPATNEGSQNAIFENLSDVISNMQSTLQQIQQNGIVAYSLITQNEKQQARLDAIRDDATMKG